MDRRATDFARVSREAHEAGMAAGRACAPAPMVVVDADGGVYRVPDGVCGFAWVQLKGNTPFGRWAKAIGVADKGYPTGLTIWVHEFGQSMTRKEAYARAYATVLRANGIDAHAASRMD